MPKRAAVPEGKAVFYRPPDSSTEESGSDSDAISPPSSPTAAAPPSSHPTPRPATRQSAIFLEEQHLDWLEDRCREARRRGGRAIRKAAVIRAILDVAMESPIDLTTLRNEDELIERVRRGLRG